MHIRVSGSEAAFAIFPRVVHFPRFVAGGRAFGGFILLIWLRSERGNKHDQSGRDWVQQRRQVEEASTQRLASGVNGFFFVYFTLLETGISLKVHIPTGKYKITTGKLKNNFPLCTPTGNNR